MKLAVWAVAVSVILPALPLLSYRVDYSVTTDAFVAGCLLVMTGGYYFARTRPRATPATYNDAVSEAVIARVLAGLGIVGSALLLVDTQAAGSHLSIGFLLENLSAIRASAFDALADSSRPSPLTFVGLYLAPCSLLAIIAAVKVGGRTLVGLAAVGFVLLAMVSLFVYGGRTTLFVALLLGLVSWYLSGKRIAVLRLRAWLYAALAVLVIAYFSVSWIDTRQGASFNPEADLAVTQHAEYHPLVAPIAQRNETVATGLLSLGYFGSPLPTLTFYLQQKPIPGPYNGAYSFPLPTRMAGRLTGRDVQPSVDLRAEVFEPLEAAGYFGNVWTTWLRDLFVDFGYTGALLACGLFGAFMAWSRNRFERTGALHYHYLEVISCLTIAFGAFTSYLPFSFLSSAFFTAVVVMFVTRVQRDNTRVSAPVGQTS